MKTAEFVLAGIMAICGLTISSSATGSTANMLPETQKQGDVTYITGGVGEGESNAMRGASNDYALEIVCAQKATPRNEFLAGVKVQMLDRHGKVVLDVITDGPYLMANLPQGWYTVTADSQGTIKKQKVRVESGKHHKVVFLWDRPSN